MDKKEILTQLGGISEAVYNKIVLAFCEETHDRLKNIADAIDTANWLAVEKLAHGIKGSAANLRLIQIQEAAQCLQEAAKSNDHIKVSKSFELLKSLVPSKDE